MTSGISLFLIAVGAILYFAVNASVSGLEIDTVGIILMVVGAIGFLWSLFALYGTRRTVEAAPAEHEVVRERRV
jgi:Na+/melibiose symporter-like transporter